MKGIELCRAFYETYGKPMLEKEFPDLLNRIAVGLVGHGSECFGYDDEISKDHDFEPGFSIWLTKEDEKLYGFRLFRAYRKLPKEFMGVSLKKESVSGSGLRGVQEIGEFYRFYTGVDGAPDSLEAWVRIPSFYLAEATNGVVFSDPLGEFTKIRNDIKNTMPEDVRKKRLASSLLLMAQSGQYNVERCVKHKEFGAAAMALSIFTEQALETIFLLNRCHRPYYKWSFRAIHSLSLLKEDGMLLESIVTHPIDQSTMEGIEIISKSVIQELIKQGYSSYKGDFLEPYAYQIQNSIASHSLRNMPIIL